MGRGGPSLHERNGWIWGNFFSLAIFIAEFRHSWKFEGKEVRVGPTFREGRKNMLHWRSEMLYAHVRLYLDSKFNSSRLNASPLATSSTFFLNKNSNHSWEEDTVHTCIFDNLLKINKKWLRWADKLFTYCRPSLLRRGTHHSIRDALAHSSSQKYDSRGTPSMKVLIFRMI